MLNFKILPENNVREIINRFYSYSDLNSLYFKLVSISTGHQTQNERTDAYALPNQVLEMRGSGGLSGRKIGHKLRDFVKTYS